jgi:hypothetical protein
MAAKVTSIPEVKSSSLAPVITSAQFSSLENSYPDDMKNALEFAEATMTSNGNVAREKAFKRAGLR